MKKSQYVIKSFIDAAGVFIYIAIIAWLGFNSQNNFGKTPSFLNPIFVLLLFVVSACITGSLVLGKPILMYLDGQKKEAITLFFYTLIWLVLFLVSIVLVFLLK